MSNKDRQSPPRRTVSLFEEESRGSSTMTSIILMIGVAIVVSGGIYVGVSERVTETLPNQPQADVSIDPGGNEIGVIVNSVDRADHLNITVDGVEVYNETGKSISPTNRDVFTLDGGGSDTDTVDIGSVSPTAWDSSNSRIPPGTTITVVATVEPDNSIVVAEFTQPSTPNN